MAKFLESLAGGLGAPSVPRTLKRLEDERTPIRIEIENSDFSFYTVLSVRPKFVVVARPADIEAGILAPGGLLRFVVPDGSRNVLRLRVRNPNYERERGDNVILCEIPEEFAEKSKRGENRFNTSRFKNLRLLIPQIDAEFRIVDISPSGCKTYVQDMEDWDVMTVGVPMRFTKVSAGAKVKIELALLTARLVTPPVVSFEWSVSPQGEAAALLRHLIASLHSKELGRLRIKEKDILAPGRGKK